MFLVPFFCKTPQLITGFQKVQENLVKSTDHKNLRQMSHKFTIFPFFSQTAGQMDFLKSIKTLHQ